jgi:hypothetical protein
MSTKWLAVVALAVVLARPVHYRVAPVVVY